MLRVSFGTTLGALTRTFHVPRRAADHDEGRRAPAAMLRQSLLLVTGERVFTCTSCTSIYCRITSISVTWVPSHLWHSLAFSATSTQKFHKIHENMTEILVVVLSAYPQSGSQIVNLQSPHVLTEED